MAPLGSSSRLQENYGQIRHFRFRLSANVRRTACSGRAEDLSSPTSSGRLRHASRTLRRLEGCCCLREFGSVTWLPTLPRSVSGGSSHRSEPSSRSCSPLEGPGRGVRSAPSSSSSRRSRRSIWLSFSMVAGSRDGFSRLVVSRRVPERGPLQRLVSVRGQKTGGFDDQDRVRWQFEFRHSQGKSG